MGSTIAKVGLVATAAALSALMPARVCASEATDDDDAALAAPVTEVVVTAQRLDVASGDVILTVLARRRQPAMPPSITTPDALRLKIEPKADCGRYDSIRKVA